MLLKKPWLLLGTILIILVISGLVFFYGSQRKSSTAQDVNVVSSETPGVIKFVHPLRTSVLLAPLIAKEKGIFEKHGLNVELIKLERGLAAAITAKNGDVAVAGINTFLSAAIGGSDVKWFGTIYNNAPYALFSNKKPEQIKKIGIDSLGLENHLITLRMLEVVGIENDAVAFVVLGEPQNRLAALTRGEIDATAMETGQWLKIKDSLATQGVTELYNTNTATASYFPIGVFARGEYIVKYPETLSKLIIALKEAQEYIAANQKEAAQVLVDKMSMKQEDAEREVAIYSSSNKGLDLIPRTDVATFSLTFLAEDNEKAKTYDVSRFINTSVAQKVK